MTIDEAIKRYEERKESLFVLLPPADFNAFSLGIEALKRVIELRTVTAFDALELLPGETEEELTPMEQRLKRGEEILALGRQVLAEGRELLAKANSPP